MGRIVNTVTRHKMQAAGAPRVNPRVALVMVMALSAAAAFISAAEPVGSKHGDAASSKPQQGRKLDLTFMSTGPQVGEQLPPLDLPNLKEGKVESLNSWARGRLTLLVTSSLT